MFLPYKYTCVMFILVGLSMCCTHLLHIQNNIECRNRVAVTKKKALVY